MNKNILIITKSFIEKNLTKHRIPTAAFNKILYDKGSLELGLKVQSVAKKYFQ